MPSESTRHGAETKPLCPGGITLCACFTSAAADGAATRQQRGDGKSPPHSRAVA